MQVGKIGSNLGFSGLWTHKQDVLCGRDKHKTPIYIREAIYHPFKDESEEEIKRTIEAPKNNGIKEVRCTKDSILTGTDWTYLDKIVVLSPSVGKTLNITGDEYKEIKKMKTSACSGNPNESYEPCENYAKL